MIWRQKLRPRHGVPESIEASFTIGIRFLRELKNRIHGEFRENKQNFDRKRRRPVFQKPFPERVNEFETGGVRV